MVFKLCVSLQSKVVCVASRTGLTGDNCESSVVSINTFYPLDRLTMMVEILSANPQVCKCCLEYQYVKGVSLGGYG